MIKYTLFFFLLFISIQSQCQEKDVNNLIAFSKLYGNVKYFHPSDEAVDIDWNKFAFYSINEILNASDYQIDTELDQLFKQIAPTLIISENPEKEHLDLKSFLPKDQIDFDTVQWQHLGNGGFNNAIIYKSLRTNRARRFYPVNYYSEEIIFEVFKSDTLSADDYQLKFRLKNEPEDSYYRVNIQSCWKNSNDEISCENFGDINTTEWLFYTDNFKIPEKSKSIYLKVKTKGAGKTLLDDIRLYKKGEKNYLKKVDFENILSGDLNLSTENKYFHGKIMRDKVAQNSFLNIYPKQILREDSLFFEPRLSYGDAIEGSLNGSVKFILPSVLLGNSGNTFPVVDSAELKVLKNSMSELYNNSDITAKNPTLRISNVIILWNTIKHFYPYLEELSVDWDEVLNLAIRRSFEDKDQYQHQKTLQWMLAKLNDSHIFVVSLKDEKDYHIPIIPELIGNKAFITSTLDDKVDLCKGDEILSINKVSINELLSENRQYVSSGIEEVKRQRAFYKAFNFFNNEKVLIKVKKENQKIKEFKLKANISDYEYVNYVDKYDKINHHRKINETIYYLNLTSLTLSKFKELLPELKSTENLILDMRGYPFENAKNFRKIIAHFTDEEISTDWMFIPEISNPGTKNEYHKLGWEISKSPASFKEKNIYYLINENAQSYSESITGFFRTFDNVTFIGSTTAGANGDISLNSLLGGFYYRFTGMKVLKHDGSRLHGIGFLPDVEVRPTIQGIIEGRDEVLEKAIELASANATANEVGKEDKEER